MTAFREHVITLPERPRTEATEAVVDVAAAEEFLRAFYAEHPDAGSVSTRLTQVRTEIAATGTYWHTSAELVHGVRMALREIAPCVTGLPDRRLRVRDLRRVRRAAGVADACFEHLRMATNGGAIQPVVTVFAPDTPERPGPRIWNEQLIRYAGYRDADGEVLGDRRYTGFTEAVRRLGWRPPAQRSPFDLLPLVVETEEEGPQLFPVPRDVVLEVPLEHPDLPWFTELGLRWHAVPAVANMRLVIGGVSYPAAPFNAWFVDSEITYGSLGADDRYGVAWQVAFRLGLDVSSERTLWRDRALLELNRAVLHSFDAGGVVLSDHHTEAQRLYARFRERSRRPHSAPASPGRPAYVLDRDAVTRGLRGGPPRFGGTELVRTAAQGPLLGALRRRIGA
ncbi:MAG TPA: nitric oxide synthase oxygenase [Pseudonocardiaceae bacterium]